MRYAACTAFLLAAAALAARAEAQIIGDNESGFYAGGGVGVFDVEIDDFDDVDDSSALWLTGALRF